MEEKNSQSKKTKSGKQRAKVILGSLAVIAIGIIKIFGGGGDSGQS